MSNKSINSRLFTKTAKFFDLAFTIDVLKTKYKNWA